MVIINKNLTFWHPQRELCYANTILLFFFFVVVVILFYFSLLEAIKHFGRKKFLLMKSVNSGKKNQKSNVITFCSQVDGIISSNLFQKQAEDIVACYID